MKISVIGTGHVGLITGVCFAERGHQVLCVDSNAAKIRKLKRGEMPIYEPGLKEIVTRNVKAKRLSFGGSNGDAVRFGKVIFISVPTPPRSDGTADLSYIEQVSRDIATNLKDYRLVVDKSTVPVLTGERVKNVITRYARGGVDFDVASNPEFLREGTAVEDTLNPDRIVFGIETRRAEKILRDLYHNFKAPIVVTDIKSAELIKHASNSFLAMKISYANALSAVCERAGADVGEVVRGMGLDERIGHQFLRAGIGYGGSCFPKDVSAFEAISRDLGYDFRLLTEVRKINQDAKKWFLRKIQEELWIVKGKKIAVFGLSFKPNTDDCRDSVAISVVESLLEMGADISAYDPQSHKAAQAYLGKKICYARSPYDAAKGSDALVLLTEWEEFRNLKWSRIVKSMLHPTLLDGRNFYDPKEMRQEGFTYRSIGRP
ncbi:MAG: UDP-glucose/GDP-mannose dehydrogenase family protein [Planctomycetota bacterium]|nr:UDP-glucose/GDP-mannose dehydrogenase family protein [Planctomycetota bacterium]